VFDVNSDGVITCEEFTKVFINMGFEERDKELKAAIEKQKRYEKRQQEHETAKVRELASRNAMKVSYEYSEEESQSAMEKLLDAAWRYDKNMPGAPSLNAFEMYSMEPHIFKEQLRRAFMMKVTPPELGAIMHYFDPERTGIIVCGDFLKKFFTMGFEERQRRKTQWREMQKHLIARRLEEEKRKLEILDKKTSIVSGSSNHDFTEADFHSAMAKLTHAAFKFDRSLPGAASLNAFEVISMPPHIFKEQLKMIFNIKVTLPELWALVSYYDRDNTGEINCKSFISQFLSTGFAERERVTRKWRKEKQQKKMLEEKLQAQKEEEKYKKAWSEVDFDFLESDFDSALWKFLMIGFNFDRRQVGPNGLKFDVETWNPAEFREMMKRTFNAKISARELGAFVNYFDTQQNRTVHVSTFLNMFTHVRVDCEEFKGKKGEQRRLQEYFQQLKEEYLQRTSKNTSVDARPWRQNSTLTVQKGLRAVFKKKDSVKPVTPLEKYRLRILVGRKTGKMDLACKSVWGTSPSTQVSLSGKEKGKKSEEHDDDSLASKEDNEEKEEEEEDDEEEGNEEEEREQNEGTKNEDEQRNDSGDIEDGLGLELNEENKNDTEITESEVMFADMALHTTRSTDEDADLPVSDAVNPSPEIEFRLSTIPPEVLRLSELRELWLCNHSISILPPKLGDLQQLQVLSLRNNSLDALPSEICKLENLQRFYVQGNNLSSLPNMFGRLSKLRDLNIASNSFTDFPEVLTSLPNLLQLDISHNKIATLPMTMRQMRSLVLLNLENNPLVPPKIDRSRVLTFQDGSAKDENPFITQSAHQGSIAPFSALPSPPQVLNHLYWMEIIGLHRDALPVSDRAAKPFTLTPTEDFELSGMLKSRAVATAANKLRHRKKKNNYIL
jgi:Ca2+-binding EF-hand superfamily protein